MIVSLSCCRGRGTKDRGADDRGANEDYYVGVLKFKDEVIGRRGVI
jgi:hypothetical protein